MPSIRPFTRHPRTRSAPSALYLSAILVSLTFGFASGSMAAESGRAADAPLDIIDATKERIRAAMKEHDIRGVSIALVSADRLIWAEGYGWADEAKRRRATANTLYPSGAISMTLTAAATLQAVERGELELDKPVRDYLSEFAPRSRFGAEAVITVRQLLSHHSGLPAMHFANMMAVKPPTLAEFVTQLREEFLVAPPGRAAIPSFPAYSVAGHVLEKRSKLAFDSLMRERLLEPLGMAQSTYVIGPQHQDTLTKTYRKGKEAERLNVRDLPAIGLHTTVIDLARFAQMLLNEGQVGKHRILKSSSVQEMLRPQNADVEFDVGDYLGLGWRLRGLPLPNGQHAVWQEGNSPFSGGRLVLVPEEKLALIVLGNSNKTYRLADDVSRYLLKRWISGDAPSAPSTTPPQTVARAGAAPELQGHYTTPLGLATIRRGDRRLAAEIFGRTVQLVEHPTGWLSIEYRFLGVLPIPIDALKEARLWPAEVGGRAGAILEYKDRVTRFAERLPRVTLSPAWQKRLGHYVAIDRDPTLALLETRQVEFKYEDGVAYFDFRMPGWLGLHSRVPVIPVSDTELVVAGTGWLMGDTIRVVRVKNEERLRYSGYHFRPVDR